jgi:signal transduction histidine kinase/CheY-like chemotaxis protein
MDAGHIALVSTGALLVAAAGLMFCLFQLWQYFWRLGQGWNLWGGAIALSMAVYSVAAFFDYNLGPGWTDFFVERVKYSCLVVLVHCLFGFTIAYFSLPYRRYLLFAGILHLAAIAVIWFTPWVISSRFSYRSLGFLPKPIVDPQLGPLGPGLLLYCLAAAAGLYALWFRQRRRHRREYNYFMAAFLVWLALAFHDLLANLGVFQPAMYLQEFGFLGFILVCLGFTLSGYRHMEESLRQSQKMEAIGTLAGGVAHDFNNILQVLSSHTEMMQAHPGLPPELHPGLESMASFLDRGAGLVRRLLTFGRKVTARATRMDLNHEVRLVAEILERTLPRMIAIELKLAPGLRPVLGDPGQVEQILLNLASNARDAMPEGGRLSLFTANLRLARHRAAEDPPLPAGDYVVLRVADTGQGMDPATLRRCYEPFFTPKAVGRVTGLGLSTVYGMVEAHGGFMACDSAPGQGTEFNIYLPANEHPAGSAPAAPAPVLQKAPEEGTVLVVDDEAAIRGLLAEHLRHLGYEVLGAATGEEALEAYHGREGQVDVVILDLSMPGMGGRRCLGKLLELDPGAKVLVASGYADADTSREMAELGAAGFLPKPFKLAELEQALRVVRSGQA